MMSEDGPTLPVSQELHATKWTSVQDGLPKPEILFLSFSRIFGYNLDMYSTNALNSTGLPTWKDLKSITHWMYLPEAPNGE